MTAARRPVFLVHPGAGAGRALARMHAILARLPVLAARSRIVAVSDLDRVRAALRELRPDEVPVAAGGDGTVTLVARALRGTGLTDRPLAVLPIGTGHAFAAAMGLGSVAAAIRAVEAGEPHAIDIMATTHPQAPLALVSISAGFESRMLAAIGASPNWRRGRRVVSALARTSLRSSTGIAIALDGDRFVTGAERIYNAGLYNLPYYGFHWLMWPDTDCTDGAAEAVACLSRWAYWRTLLRGLPTAQPTSFSHLRSRRWHRAQFDVAGPVQIDGDVVGAAAFEVVVEPGALQVLRLPRD